MADSILTNLVQQLGALALEEYKVLRGVGDQLKFLENELRFMKKFLRNSEGKQQEHGLVTELVEQIKEIAFEAEDIIETFLLNAECQKRRTSFGRVLHLPEHSLMLRGMAKQIEGIKMSINDVYANKERYGIEIGEGSINPHFEATLQRRRKEVDEEMVGFIDVADLLLKKLTEGSTELEVISIVGMGGLGKTTIAKRLYNDRIMEDHFTSRAWVSVSEDYDTRQVILTLLSNTMPQADHLEKEETDELKNVLRAHLLKKKYIIFLDDVWQTNMWDEVQACFPDKNNGSKILITTRNTNVARHASPKEPHFLRFLNCKESWELFEKKVFRGDPCYSHLQTLGKDIVEKCKGLPLSIVVIASMLASQEKSEKIWSRTLKDVSVHLGKDEACLEILALSYHNLPVELKPCFLYFAAFPEDYEMSVRRLIALWLAEGFIQPLGELTVEEVAESYLDALIDRSLVQAGNKGTDGGLKTCRVHDLIRDLCIREARSENFMWATSKINDSSSIISKSKPRRLSVHRYTTRTILSKEWVPSSIRAFLSFDSQKTFASSALWKKLYTEYRLIRVLDLGAAIKVEAVPEDIDNLANLRYLRLFLNSVHIPISIYNLRNLQMLFVEGAKSLNIPIGALVKLQCLQQLNLGGSITKLYGNSNAILPQKQLKSLQVLSSIYPDNDFECAIMNGLCPNLKKLSLCSSYANSWSLKSYFASLPNLQSLKICSSDSNVKDDIFRGVSESELPSNLTKVTLKSSNWSNDSLNMLGKLSNLRILKLRDVKRIGFEVKKGSFPRLQTLHLDNIQGGSIELDGFSILHGSQLENISSNLTIDRAEQGLLYMYESNELEALTNFDFKGLEGYHRIVQIFAQLRCLFVKRCLCRFGWSGDIFTLPSLEDIQVLWPSGQLADSLERFRLENVIKCRLLVHKGD
ncbi:Disease resistance protein RPP13 [Bienertia sinuspersici]